MMKMLKGIDVSNHQGKAGLRLAQLQEPYDFVIVKATGGTRFVDKYCDPYIEQAKKLGKLWGFYHFAHDLSGKGNAFEEADFFVGNTLNYFGEGIPVLDWEVDSVSVQWVNEFVERVHDSTSVWCWIYANPWRFNQGGVNANCARWIAAYPLYGFPSLDSDPGNIPKTEGLVSCWQYSGTGRVKGWTENLDLNHFYGDVNAWMKYARGGRISTTIPPNGGNSSSVLENNEYRITVERKG